MRTSLLTALFSVALIACSDAATQQSNEPMAVKHTLDNKAEKAERVDFQAVPERSDINQAHQSLNSLISDTQCDDASQCKVLPVGSRACGGPSSYIVYSTKTAAQQAVEKQAKHITRLESQFNAANDMMSICQHLTEPGAQCAANKCVKVEGSSASVY